MLGKTKLGTGDEAGFYPFEANNREGYQLSSKFSTWQGPRQVMEALGLEPGQAVDKITFLAIARGINPDKKHLAFNDDATFNSTAFLAAAWNQAHKGQRKAMLATLKRAGLKMKGLSYTSSSETLTKAWSSAFGTHLSLMTDKQGLIYRMTNEPDAATRDKIRRDLKEGRAVSDVLHDLNMPAGTPGELLAAAWGKSTPQQRVAILKRLVQGNVDLGNLYQVKQTPPTVEDLAPITPEVIRSLYNVSLSAAESQKLAARMEKAAIAAAKKVIATTVQAASAAEKLRKAAFSAAGVVPGFTLVQNAGPGRQLGIDLTPTMPKDPSTFFARADAKTRVRIINILNTAANWAVVGYLNEYCGETRAGAQGQGAPVKCQYLVGAFTDLSARPVTIHPGDTGSDDVNLLKTKQLLKKGYAGGYMDSHLHCHMYVLNTVLSEDNKFRAMDMPKLFQAQGAIGERFHAMTAHLFQQEFGLTILKDGKTTGFKIAEIDPAWSQEMSHRTASIEEFKKEFGLENVPNDQIASNLLDAIKKESRGEHISPTDQELLAHWRARLDSVGFTQPVFERIIADGKHKRNEYIKRQDAFPLPTMADIHYLVEAAGPFEKREWAPLLQNDSEFSDHDLRAAVYRAYTGKCDPRKLDAVCNEYLKTQTFLVNNEGKQLYTSKKKLLEEVTWFDLTKYGKTKITLSKQQIREAIDHVKAIKKAQGKPVSEEQERGAEYLLSGDAFVRVLVAPAGAGKTFMLEILEYAYRKNGFTTLATSQTWVASNQMVSEGRLAGGSALAKLAHDINHGRVHLTNKHVVVLDEMSLVSSSEYYTVCVAAAKAGAKIIMTGDDKQIPAVQAGSPARKIISAIGCFESKEVWRQRKGWDKQAGLDIRQGGEFLDRGIQAHIDHGRLTVTTTEIEARTALFKKWLEDYGKGTQLMVATRNADVNVLNQLARQSLMTKGIVHSCEALNVKVGDNVREIEVGIGDLIQFRQKSDKNTNVAEDDVIVDGQVFNRTRATIRGFVKDVRGTVCGITVETWSGDQLTGNFISLTGENFREKYLSLDFAYAVTADSAQGMTVDKCYAMPGSMSTERFYVAATRHRDDFYMFISCEEMAKKARQFYEAAMKSSALNDAGYIDKNDFTPEMATEMLIATLKKRGEKALAIDRISDLAVMAGQSCLAGTRFAELINHDKQLLELWKKLSIVNQQRDAIANSQYVPPEQTPAQIADSLVRNAQIAAKNLEGTLASIKNQLLEGIGKVANSIRNLSKRKAGMSTIWNSPDGPYAPAPRFIQLPDTEERTIAEALDKANEEFGNQLGFEGSGRVFKMVRAVASRLGISINLTGGLDGNNDRDAAELGRDRTKRDQGRSSQDRGGRKPIDDTLSATCPSGTSTRSGVGLKVRDNLRAASRDDGRAANADMRPTHAREARLQRVVATQTTTTASQALQTGLEGVSQGPNVSKPSVAPGSTAAKPRIIKKLRGPQI